MRRFSLSTIIIVLAMFFSISSQAQNTLVGRIYHNPNIMEKELVNMVKDAEKDIDKRIDEVTAKEEKKKGRALTDKEKVELKEKVVEAKQMLNALSEGMSTAVTVEFRNETEAVMKMDMKISDEAMKKAGVNWLKRKAMKAALAIAPKSEKEKYLQKGNIIIFGQGKDQDTLRLSNDGKYLYGKDEKGKEFVLTRQK